MTLRILGLVLICGCGATVPLLAAQGDPPAASPAAPGGASFTQTLEKSRFNVGAGAHVEISGAYQRVVGEEGVFMIDTVTGATLAVPNAPDTGAKGTAAAIRYPEPLSKNPDEHNAAARRYLLASGVPAAEVSGLHVTTTMAGGGPISAGLQPSKSELLWYTTHLERSVGGIPVEGSYAFAALDKSGHVITEGVYWPSIPAEIVREAQALKRRLASTTEEKAFRAMAGAAASGVQTMEKGEVKIVHTESGYHGQFEAKAVYSLIARSAFGGKAQIIRLDQSRAVVRLPDAREPVNEVDSPKHN